MRRAATDESGRFVFKNVAHGLYRLRAVSYPTWPADVKENRSLVKLLQLSALPDAGVLVSRASRLAPIPIGPTYWADEPVEIGRGRPASLQPMTLQPGFRLDGRIDFDESGGVPPPPSEFSSRYLRVRAASGTAIGDFPVATLRTDRTFTTVGLPLGDYFLSIEPAFPGWFLRRIRIDGRDAMGRPIGVTGAVSDVVLSLTRQSASATGSVRDDRGGPVPFASVILFTVDRANWRQGLRSGSVVLTRADQRGNFHASCLPGDYYVAAVKADLSDDWQSEQFLRGLIAVADTKPIASGQDVRVALIARR